MTLRPPLRILFVMLTGALPLQGLQVRAFDPARHNRFTGFPAAPAANPDFLLDVNRFTGLGWDLALPSRQFALVSPRHFLCATHYPPAPGAVVRFLNASGELVDRVVSSVCPVPGKLGQPGSLALGTLDAPLGPDDGVTPFACLSVAEETQLIGTALQVFGLNARAGRGSLREFRDFAEPGTARTRCCVFAYPPAAGQADDCRLETGDSGSPSFARIAGVPALVGIHSAISSESGNTVNWDTHLAPFWQAVNDLMAPLGYQLQTALAEPAAITCALASSPANPRQRMAASLSLDLRNPTSQDTADVIAEIEFRGDTQPDSITPAAGWTTEAAGPTLWRFRLPALTAGSGSRFTATWQQLPASAALDGELRLSSSAAADGLHFITTKLLPSYAAWSSGLAAPGPEADPDHDGVTNLAEYAFGGEPSQASRRMAAGPPLFAVAAQNGELVFSFPRRTDAATRGINYVVEYSADLTENSWTSQPPAGTWSATAAFDPPVTGFRRQSVHCPANGPARFCRVRVELAE